MSAQPLVAAAPGKVNLCLYLGPTRADGKHELVSVVQAVSLADDVALAPAPPDVHEDEVVCPGVEGPNLALAALEAFRRATGWDGPPMRITIDKRVPVAAGMGGGSADAAAVLRLAARASGLGTPELLHELGADLGADVPAALSPGRSLTTGAGETVTRLAPEKRELAVLVLPADGMLSTAAVFAEADRLGLPRDADGLGERLGAASKALDAGDLPAELMVNDLEPAARSLFPAVDEALEATERAGADRALVSGSGPTVAGLFLGDGAAGRAQEAARALQERRPQPVVATPATGDLS